MNCDIGLSGNAVGFTGTSQIGAVTANQIDNGKRLLYTLKARGYTEFHHGDCIEADEHFAVLAHQAGFRIIVHPPINVNKRAYGIADEYRPAKAYLIRNHDIVDETDVLIAVPKSPIEELRSGTWATVRYARKLKRRIYIITP